MPKKRAVKKRKKQTKPMWMKWFPFFAVVAAVIIGLPLAYVKTFPPTSSQSVASSWSGRNWYPPTSKATPTPSRANPSPATNNYYPTPTGYVGYPTPTIARPSYSCSANSYQAGTFCTSSTTCYDVYCNASGNGTRSVQYAASTCGFCGSYRCAANSFIAGTYNDSGTPYDVYCNSTGNGTVRRY